MGEVGMGMRGEEGGGGVMWEGEEGSRGGEEEGEQEGEGKGGEVDLSREGDKEEEEEEVGESKEESKGEEVASIQDEVVNKEEPNNDPSSSASSFSFSSFPPKLLPVDLTFLSFEPNPQKEEDIFNPNVDSPRSRSETATPPENSPLFSSSPHTHTPSITLTFDPVLFSQISWHKASRQRTHTPIRWRTGKVAVPPLMHCPQNNMPQNGQGNRRVK
mmetsp:Transcript_17262/g.26979  ORF Transcript_17262/g.26979 Transcript_17262/m.26979 type:complete len:216 (-) Transcript_17262:258-905(-)|eukprot:CAMPEP_0201533624 /NCGR_PEP_ID=MMETSP0161_2-20130828/53779_1 /ASSEMBLY_ACC=CAM_ASM_000251 /TAXON_ID=180227 /ORGANISM="Neoparamoeba aestuarina, Strain SoJaBio B1-5/56/2" /LENGTH=215 /DNA_ID=CAMNT_0047937749 /DNA_START=667 /DNA_END=1314 /DNA_ORIENTATION=+